MTRRIYASLIATSCMFHGIPAFAQTAVQAETNSAAVSQTSTTPTITSEEPQTGDIVVTAQRREQRLQDVPVSVAALSGAELREKGAASLNDLISLTPGIQFSAPAGNSGFPVFNIRGVQLTDFSYMNESSVAVYADDIYQGNAAFASQQLFDINRVEILRGPQGTLYGRNATGGLVSFIFNRPTSEWSGTVFGQYGSYNDVVFESAISGPITNGVRVRLAGRFNRNDGYQVNQVTGTRLAFVDHALGLRGTVEVDLAPSVLLTLVGSYSDTAGSEDGRAFYGTRTRSNFAASCAPPLVRVSGCVNAVGFTDPDPDPRRPFSERTSLPYDLNARSGVAKLEADLGFGKLVSITGYEAGRKFDEIDVDASAVSGTSLLVKYFIRHKQFSQELRLGGDAGRLNWLVGGFYYTDKRFFTAELTDVRTGNYADQKISSISAFAQGTYALTDTVNFTAGGRFTKDRKNLEDLALVQNPSQGTRNGTVLFLTSSSIDPSRFNWRLGADWHITPNVMVYGTAATGFKSGGYNTALVTSLRAVGPAEPENIKTYEGGIKSQWLDRKLTFNLSAYYSDYRNIQAAVTTPCTDPTCITPTGGAFINIGRAKIYGAEAELVMRPASNFSVSLGASLNHNKLRAPPTITVAGVPLDGKKLANTPKVTIGGGLNWEPSLGTDAGSLVFGTDFKFQSQVYFRPDNTPLAQQPAYALVGARVGWRSQGGLLIEAFSTNVLDEEYFVSQTSSGETAPATWGKPRMFGIRGSKSF